MLRAPHVQRYLQRPEENVESPGTRVTCGCDLSYMDADTYSGSLEVQRVLLTAQTSR